MKDAIVGGAGTPLPEKPLALPFRDRNLKVTLVPPVDDAKIIYNK